MKKIASNKTLLVQKAAAINEHILKRGFDFFVASCFLLFIFSWLYPIIALLIKLETNGLALFVQERIGLNGKVFKCYKFRTLHTDKNATHSTSITLNYTTPSTKVGSFLRKFNLDELPQFINVFLGQMSIVGPRPHAIKFHALYATYVSNINNRLLVKPGITGLAQIQGLRGDVEDEMLNKINIQKRVDADIEYILNWSFGLDLKIFCKTFFKV